MAVSAKILLLAFLPLLAVAEHHHRLVSVDFLTVALKHEGSEELPLSLDEEQQVELDGCSSERFRRCLNNYAGDLGLERVPKDSIQFVRAMARIIQEQGVEGFKRECTAGTNLRRCLGDQFDTCISEKYLISKDVAPADAKVFITFSVQMSYQCSEGFDVIINNWDCIMNVERGHRQDFARCQNEYAQKVQADPSQVCKYTQELVNCMSIPYKTCPPVVYGTLCHSMQVSLTSTLPQCTVVCTKGVKDVDMSGNGRVDTFSTFVARTVLDHVPSRYLQSDPSPRGKCNDSRLRRCMSLYAKDLGLTKLPRRANALAVYLSQLLSTKRTAGFDQMCEAATNAIRCIGGPQQVAVCFSEEHLRALDVPAQDSIIYRELIGAMSYECGAGYHIIREKIDCLVQSSEEKQTQAMRCAEEFEQKITLDPSNTCKHAQTYLRCTTRLFETGCGEELGAHMCNALRAELMVPLSVCKNLTCLLEADAVMSEDDSGWLSATRAVSLTEFQEMNDADSSESSSESNSAETTTGKSSSSSSSSSESKEPNARGNAKPDSSSESSSQSDENQRSSVVTVTKAKCDDKKLSRCSNAFAKQLGLKAMPADPAEFAKALNSIMQKYGKVGFKKICTASRKAGACLGLEQAKACINIEHFMKLGLKKPAATAFYIMSRALAYECVRGYKVIYENFDCITETQESSTRAFKRCLNDFQRKVKRDPKHACKYVQPLIDCDLKPFSEKCGRQVSTTLCNVFKVVLKPLAPKCPVKCNREDGDETPAVEEITIIDIPEN